MTTAGQLAHAGILVLATGALGSIIAISELSSRFRDEPVKILKYPASLIYIGLNVVISVIVLALAYAFNWRFGVAPGKSGQTVDIIRVLVAGLGSALVLRSSLMTVRVGDKDVDIGLSAAFTSLLNLLEERIDRRRAGQRLKLDYWHDLSFSEDYGALVTLVSYSLQRPDQRDADSLGALAADLQKQPSLSDGIRLDRLCFALLNIAGEATVKAAADRLRREKKVKAGASGAGETALVTPGRVGPEEAAPTRQGQAAPLPDTPVAPDAEPGQPSTADILGGLADALPQYVEFRQAQLVSLIRSNERATASVVISDAVAARPQDPYLKLLAARLNPAEIERMSIDSGAPADLHREMAFLRVAGEHQLNLIGRKLENLESYRWTNAPWSGQVYAAKAIEALYRKDYASAVSHLKQAMMRLDHKPKTSMLALVIRDYIDNGLDHGPLARELISESQELHSIFRGYVSSERNHPRNSEFLYALNELIWYLIPGVDMAARLPGSTFLSGGKIFDMVSAQVSSGAPAERIKEQAEVLVSDLAEDPSGPSE